LRGLGAENFRDPAGRARAQGDGRFAHVGLGQFDYPT
jgi:hypothetical protein